MNDLEFAVKMEEYFSNNITHAKPQKSVNKRMSNAEWIDFLTEQFDISRTSAKEMLHVMMQVKKEDNFKKQFSGRK